MTLQKRRPSPADEELLRGYHEALATSSPAELWLFLLTLVPVPGDVPPIVRIRRALKVLRRAFGLRCVSVEEL